MSQALPEAVVQLLETRAVRLAAPALAGEVDDAEWLAVFPVGDLDVAIPLAGLRAALPLRRVTAVPLAATEVVGVVRFGGHVLPVYSLAFMLGGQASRRDSAYLLVVERSPGRLVAFDCVQVPLATTRSQRELELARARASGPLTDLAGEGRVLTLVDVGRLCDQWEKKHGA